MKSSSSTELSQTTKDLSTEILNGHPFVEGWYLVKSLGEGAFGQVCLAMQEVEFNKVAVKIIDMEKHPDSKGTIDKEVQVHKRLIHDNIVKLYGDRTEGNMRYIFLEYVNGCELFDRIDPDKGLAYA